MRQAGVKRRDDAGAKRARYVVPQVSRGAKRSHPLHEKSRIAKDLPSHSGIPKILRANNKVRACLSRDSAFNQVVSMHERWEIVVPQKAADCGQILRGELKSADVGIQGTKAIQ